MSCGGPYVVGASCQSARKVPTTGTVFPEPQSEPPFLAIEETFRPERSVRFFVTSG